MAKKRSAWWMLVAGVVIVVGCSKTVGEPETSAETGRLKEIHELYTDYVKANKAPPKQLSDINVRTYSEIYPGAVSGIKEGKYVVVWGVSGTDGGTVLAYPKDAPEKGGPVVMADGKVKTMTADELKAAIKK